MAEIHAVTATIYQFPIPARKARRNLAVDATVMPLDRNPGRFADATFADAAYGGGWYHDAAIEADKPKS